jgi:CheY-like chemotaxis protein
VETNDLDGPPGTRRVLVCDDEFHIVRLLQRQLERQGHQVTSAADGREAIERLENGAFDLVVLDPELPQVGGHELRDWIRSRPNLDHIEVVLLERK